MKPSPCCTQAPTVGRRAALSRIALLGGGAALLSATPWMRPAAAAGRADALLLSCMDYRLMDDIERYMAGRGLRDRYDHVVLAGGSLGATAEQFPAWRTTFWEHLELSIALHAIHTVIVLDHRDCGAFKGLLGDAHLADADTERAAHLDRLQRLRGQIAERHPALKVETLLMALDGSVEVVS